MIWEKNHKIYCQLKKNNYLCNRKNAIKREKATLTQCLPSESIFIQKAQVAELVDAHVSGACAARREGSSPFLGTAKSDNRLSFNDCRTFVFDYLHKNWRYDLAL